MTNQQVSHFPKFVPKQNLLHFIVQIRHATSDEIVGTGGETPYNPTLDDLKPLIEVVHHLCQTGDYDEAFNIFLERIHQGNRGVIVFQLGAYETSLALMQSFFPNGDISQEAQVSDPGDKSWILNGVGLCLMDLGRIGEAAPIYQRKIQTDLSREAWKNASIGYRNLAELYANLGKLTPSAEAASKALVLARRADHRQGEVISLALQSWTDHLQGNLEFASDTFQQAEMLKQKIYPNQPYLFSFFGIWQADHLQRIGNADYARRVTEANLKFGTEYPWPRGISQCHLILGDLDADADNHDSAQSHYQEALKIARSISDRAILIQALLAQGRWLAKQGKVAVASRDLDEALNYAVAGGYRIYEADIRVGLAWAYLKAGNPSAAQTEAEKAQRMSEEMGYHWGQVDAQEVLAALE